MKKLWLMCMLISSAINAQTFDFSCDPFADIIAEFRDDTGYKGSINARLLTRAEIAAEGVSLTSTRTVAYAYRCDSQNRFVYVQEHWNMQSYGKRKKIVYHELGHTIFDYTHPALRLNERDPTAFGNFAGDIMGYVSWLVPEHIQWPAALARFVSGTDHTYYDCYTGKGITIIED